jgi:hypothetical membrane protein
MGKATVKKIKIFLMGIYIYTHTHTHTHIYIYMYIYMYIRLLQCYKVSALNNLKKLWITIMFTQSSVLSLGSRGRKHLRGTKKLRYCLPEGLLS